MNDQVTRLHTRDEIEDDLLVVDYVAGRLDDDARAAFEARLEDDDDLLARVIEERGFRHAVVDAVTGECPDASAFDKLDIDRVEEPVKRASAWRRSAIVASLLAAVTVVLFMDRPGQMPDEEFTTLSNEAITPVTESNRVRLVFAEGTSETDRIEAGNALGFEILRGPGPAGAYVVTTPEVLSRDDLASWRDDPRIDLAEPVQYEQAP